MAFAYARYRAPRKARAQVKGKSDCSAANTVLCMETTDPRHEKTGFLPMR